jgi:hypothetical protein
MIGGGLETGCASSALEFGKPSGELLSYHPLFSHRDFAQNDGGKIAPLPGANLGHHSRQKGLLRHEPKFGFWL